MYKLLILLLISVPCVADKSLLKHSPVESEFILYIPDLSNRFEQIISSKDKCSLESYRNMEKIINEVYVWVKFQKSVESIEMLNTLTEKLGTFGEQEKPIYSPEDVLNNSLPDLEDITQDAVLEQLNQWRIRECTYIGKGVHFYETFTK
jgi:hypothetical protein